MFILQHQVLQLTTSTSGRNQSWVWFQVYFYIQGVFKIRCVKTKNYDLTMYPLVTDMVNVHTLMSNQIEKRVGRYPNRFSLVRPNRGFWMTCRRKTCWVLFKDNNEWSTPCLQTIYRRFFDLINLRIICIITLYMNNALCFNQLSTNFHYKIGKNNFIHLILYVPVCPHQRQILSDLKINW